MKWLSMIVAAGLVVGICGCGETKKVSGEGGAVLKVTGPAATTLKQGESKDITVKIGRTKFDDPVKVTLSDLPAGVTADEMTRTAEKGATEVQFTLKAADDAKPEDNHKGKVTATAKDMKDTVEFTVSVKSKK